MDNREKERLLLNLRSTPNELDDLAEGVNDEVWGWRPIPTKWSVKEIVCHLTDIESEAFCNRYKVMLTQDEPYLSKVDQDALAGAGDYFNRNGIEALAEFKRRRAETISLLGNIEPDLWLRTGSHWSLGRVSMHDLVMRQCEHDLNHLGQIKDIVRLRMPW